MAKTKIIQAYVKVFGGRVIKGTWTCDPNEKGKTLVPETYREAVSEWVANYLKKFIEAQEGKE